MHAMQEKRQINLKVICHSAAQKGKVTYPVPTTTSSQILNTVQSNLPRAQIPAHTFSFLSSSIIPTTISCNHRKSIQDEVILFFKITVTAQYKKKNDISNTYKNNFAHPQNEPFNFVRSPDPKQRKCRILSSHPREKGIPVSNYETHVSMNFKTSCHQN